MKIYAKSCIIKDLSEEKEIVKKFLKENHTQGSIDFAKSYGLFYEGELVQVMSFGKPRYNKNFQWELLRDCSKKDCIVYEGVSTIWKNFICNNIVRSCVCYSYPHNIDNLFTNKYVDHCGFTNIKKAKPAKKVYFEGVWNREIKHIDKSILERHGADRLLGGKFGQDKTNEQILLDLGFEKKSVDGFSPQVDSYFPFGVVYKVTDLNTSKFYIGKCEIEEKWNSGYTGSGTLWARYYDKYSTCHSFKREVLKDDFNTPKEMLDFEAKEIQKYCENGKIADENCLNILTESQSVKKVCSECGGYLSHKSNCSKHKPTKVCLECGLKGGWHSKKCSLYKERKACAECGGIKNHKSSCSHFNKKNICEECNGVYGHYKSCSKYKIRICKECGSNSGHKKSCSKYKERVMCKECGGKSSHKKTCSKYKQPKPCEECGNIKSHKKTCSKFARKICDECGVVGSHKDSCSKSKGKCSECGYSLQSNKHSPSCKFYKEAKKRRICNECGSGSSHKKTCSKYKPVNVCSECGGKRGNHYKNCKSKSI